MNRITLILIILVSLSSCKKRNFIYEDKMWNKLSKGNGIWLLEKREYTQVNTDGTTEIILLEEPVDTKYYFYTKIIKVFGTSVENDYLEITEFNEATNMHQLKNSFFISRLAGGAENQRITLENPAGGVDRVYTIEKGGSNKQVWVNVSGGTGVVYKEIITIKKCNSCTPDYVGNGEEVTG